MGKVHLYSVARDIPIEKWQALVAASPTATWFQTPEAYVFFASLPEMMTPFVVAVEENDRLTGIVVGYITREKSAVKQFFTRRAIVVGGPLLAADISDEALEQLLVAVTENLKHRAIYIETRNFSDYGRWRAIFERCGFSYQPHLNFQVDCSSLEVVDGNLGRGRKRDIRTSLRDGAVIVENPTPAQVAEFYEILHHLYTTKVKTPLFSFDFFKKLYALPSGRILLVELNGKIIGGTVCVCLEGKAVYEWFVCGIDGVYKNIFPSSLATYAGIRYAAQHAMPIFDMMGAGTPDEDYGVRDFKARFGGKLVEFGRYLYLCNPALYKIGKLGVKILKMR